MPREASKGKTQQCNAVCGLRCSCMATAKLCCLLSSHRQSDGRRSETFPLRPRDEPRRPGQDDVCRGRREARPPRRFRRRVAEVAPRLPVSREPRVHETRESDHEYRLIKYKLS